MHVIVITLLTLRYILLLCFRLPTLKENKIKVRSFLLRHFSREVACVIVTKSAQLTV